MSAPGPSRLRRPFLTVFAPAVLNQRGEVVEDRIVCKGETTDLDQATAMAEAQRDFDCPQYISCLDLAIREDWPSFECTRCALFRRRP